MSSPMGALRVGVDIGGTFTDLVFLAPDGRLHKRKRPSTPADYSEAIVRGVIEFCEEQRLPPNTVAEIVHATTVATNAILERKGARTALLTTEGFRDVLELRRIRIPMSYDLGWRKPPPLVERALRLPIRERVDAAGRVLTPLDSESLEQALAALTAADVQAVAVCFLHAYRNGAHERRVGEMLRQRLPHAYVSLSHEVLPEIREFERTSTTVVNAYVAPLIARYLGTLRDRLNASAVRAPLLVMQSNGGLVSADVAAERPVTIIESGPAAGVVAAARLARDSGHDNVITLDMGGTTTKASIVEGGEILRATEYEVGSAVSVSSRLMRGNGYTLRIPVIDVSEVGAGGGSIAAIDAGGSLRVGPGSAGAVPGPACYGQGNELPTVTDANLILGYLHSRSLAGGALAVRRELAEAAVRRHICRRSGLSLDEAALGIHMIANSNMVRAIKSVSVERGRDPADFVLMAFGGAGPIHVAGVARELGIRRVLVPPAPGVFSAFGLLRAQVELHAVRTVLASTRDAPAEVTVSMFEAMHTDVVDRLGREGYAPSAIGISNFVDLRYRGQSSEITVPFDVGATLEDELRRAEARFEAEFERTYGHRGRSGEFELVTCRAIASVARGAEHGEKWAPDPGDGAGGGERVGYFGPEWGELMLPVVARGQLGTEARKGPLVVQEYDTSIVVPPDCAVAVDGRGNVILEVGIGR